MGVGVQSHAQGRFTPSKNSRGYDANILLLNTYIACVRYTYIHTYRHCVDMCVSKLGKAVFRRKCHPASCHILSHVDCLFPGVYRKL